MKLTDLTRYILPGDKTQDILDQAARARAAVERSAAALQGRAVPLDSAVSAQMEARLGSGDQKGGETSKKGKAMVLRFAATGWKREVTLSQGAVEDPVDLALSMTAKMVYPVEDAESVPPCRKRRGVERVSVIC